MEKLCANCFKFGHEEQYCWQSKRSDGTKNGNFCSYCNKNNHTISNCFKIPKIIHNEASGQRLKNCLNKNHQLIEKIKTLLIKIQELQGKIEEQNVEIAHLKNEININMQHSKEDQMEKAFESICKEIDDING